jgi:hypothetical protein
MTTPKKTYSELEQELEASKHEQSRLAVGFMVMMFIAAFIAGQWFSEYSSNKEKDQKLLEKTDIISSKDDQISKIEILLNKAENDLLDTIIAYKKKNLENTTYLTLSAGTLCDLRWDGTISSNKIIYMPLVPKGEGNYSSASVGGRDCYNVEGNNFVCNRP